VSSLGKRLAGLETEVGKRQAEQGQPVIVRELGPRVVEAVAYALADELPEPARSQVLSADPDERKANLDRLMQGAHAADAFRMDGFNRAERALEAYRAAFGRFIEVSE
jgi:hypothetical protein